MTCRPLGCVVGNRWLTSEEEKAEARGHVSRPQGEPEPGRRGRSTQPPEAAEPQHRARRGREPVAARPLPGGAAKSTAGKRVATELTSALAEEAHRSGPREGLGLGRHVIGSSPLTSSRSNSGPPTPPPPNGAARAPHWALARTKTQGPARQRVGLL